MSGLLSQYLQAGIQNGLLGSEPLGYKMQDFMRSQLGSNEQPVREGLNSMFSNMDTTDKAALGLSMVPGVGDVVGLGNDARHWYQDHISPGGKDWTPTDYALVGAGALPLIPAGYALKKALKPAEELSPSIRTFHGSPHQFSNFDSSAIGTGEGAQAYGHGAYFAQEPRVAKAYVEGPKGTLYKTKINADQSKMFNWDLPFEEQPSNVKDALGRISQEAGGLDFTGLKGEDIYHMLDKDPAGASAMLNQLDVPGIQYYDGSSRAAQAGTRNFVVFDPDKVQIQSSSSHPLLTAFNRSQGGKVTKAIAAATLAATGIGTAINSYRGNK